MIRRLLDDPADDFEQELLRSAELDVPSNADVVRGVLSVGAAAGAIAAAGSAAAKASSAGASVVQGAGQAASLHGALGAGVALKWIGAGLVTAALAGTGAAAVVTRYTENSEHVVPRRPLSAQVPVPRAVTTPSEVAPPPASTPAAQRSPKTSVARTPDPASAVPNAHPTGTLGAELAVLSRARLAQASRAPGSVLAELEAYEHLPRPHVLAGEAAMLRMEALVQLGQSAKAANLARDYLRAHPSSPHRARLEAIANES